MTYPSREYLELIARRVRYHIVTATTRAGSGHPSSSLSATDLMVTLMFGGFFSADIKNPQLENNDRLIFSKGHAAPLLYALYVVAGVLKEREMLTLRQWGSSLEGHPVPTFPYAEAATGSLGQGLSVGVGMALQARFCQATKPYRVFVLLGDSEMAEGSNYEAMAVASQYKLINLIAIVDVNRLGQRGQTMYGHDLQKYAAKAEAFGWEAVTCDGHSIEDIIQAYSHIQIMTKPLMIIARTVKGKGVKHIEDIEGWHGKALSEKELEQVESEWGAVDTSIVGVIPKPPAFTRLSKRTEKFFKKTVDSTVEYALGDSIAPRKAYGAALNEVFLNHPNMVVLDAETSNSTYAETFKKKNPEHFFEMFIAEQNMVGVALGMSRRGQKPFCSTFAAFFTRAADQLRMAQYSGASMVCVGSHAGVSIGEDGVSQMGLEDIALFRSLFGSVVLYPSDAVAMRACVFLAAEFAGMTYIRSTRAEVPVLYSLNERFSIGGSKTIRSSATDTITLVAAGITLHEALHAGTMLEKSGIHARIIDVYSVKPLDKKTLVKAMHETKAMIVVEDHYPEGGIYSAITELLSPLAFGKPIVSCAPTKLPHSGKPSELLNYEGIDARGIVKQVQIVLKKM